MYFTVIFRKKSQILKINSLLQHLKQVVELEIYLDVSSPAEGKGPDSPAWTRSSGKMTQGEKGAGGMKLSEAQREGKM